MSELRPNKKLVNHKFDGYKLASTSLKMDSFPLLSSVNEPSRASDMYSYVHTHCHQTHNHLYHDEWNSNVYFIDADRQVNTFLYTENGKPSSIYQVYSIPHIKRSFDSCACTLQFPCESIAVLCDGGGGIYLLHTGNRKTQELQHWKHEENILYNFDSATYLYHTKIEQDILHIVALSLRPKETGTSSQAVYNWLQVKLNFENPGESVVKGIKRFLGVDVPNAVWFSNDYSQLMMAASKSFSLVDESFKKIEPKVGAEPNKDHHYDWTQTKELVSISFLLCVTENEIDVEIKHNHISVRLKNGKKLLEGSLEKEIIVDASRWYVEKNKLEVVLIKKTGDGFWTALVPMDTCGGHHVIEGEEAERVEQISESLNHLTSDNEKAQQDTHTFNMAQLEECDEDEKDVKLYSINVFTGQVEKSRNFSGHQWLFKNPSNNGQPPLICLRHDVDGILWQPNDVDWEHKATFDAFGYVHASKKDRKYTSCSPNFKYAYITDCISNIYIYESDSTNPYQHNQYIICLHDANRILGCQATNYCLYVITDKHINVVHFPE